MSRGRRLSGMAGMTAILCVAAWYMADASMRGGRCKSVACTYFDSSGKGRQGTCGEKSGDDTKCYCIVNDDKNLAQEQSGCVAKR